MPEAELTCRELVELVTEELEGALPAAQRTRYLAHLAACEGCADHVEQLHVTLRVLRALRDLPPG